MPLAQGRESPRRPPSSTLWQVRAVGQTPSGVAPALGRETAPHKHFQEDTRTAECLVLGSLTTQHQLHRRWWCRSPQTPTQRALRQLQQTCPGLQNRVRALGLVLG